jgi:hypothetical protein
MATSVQGKSILHRGKGDPGIKTQAFIPQGLNVELEKWMKKNKITVRSEAVRVLLAEALGYEYSPGEYTES